MKTQTSLREDKVRRISLDAAFLCCALALSYLEHLIPFSVIIPLPGFKLGFANLAVIAAAYLFSLKDAALISVSRITLSALLFGNFSTLFFSLFGGLASFFAICLSKLILYRISGYIGISVICAVCHNMGQLVYAAFMVSSLKIVSYAPALLIAAAITGTITGIILMSVMPMLVKLLPHNMPSARS